MTPEEARAEQEWINNHRRYTRDSDLVPDDMRATIAAQTWEWGTFVPEHDDEPAWWPTERDARLAASEDALIRLVRRPVGPVEVVEG